MAYCLLGTPTEVSSHALLHTCLFGDLFGRRRLGFFGVAGIAAEIARVLFFIFLVLFIVSLVNGRRSRPLV
ncbi:MAG: DUF1328 domain-containing protein [Candidatus Binataceae bacterium]